MKFPMKALRMCQWALLALALALTIGCATDDDGEHRKVVGPHEDISGLPWDRPTALENGGGLGSILPQSH